MLENVFLLFYNLDSYYTLTEDLDVNQIEKDDIIELSLRRPILIISGLSLLDIEEEDSTLSIFDLNFIRFIIQSQKKQEEFKDALIIIEDLLSLNLDEWNDPKEILFKLLKLFYIDNLQQLFKNNVNYYKTIGIATLSNTNYLNQQNIQIDFKKILENKNKENIDLNIFRIQDEKYFLPINVNCFKSENGRLNSNLYTIISKVKPYFIGQNDKVVEFDTVAAEWRFLLGVCNESDLKFGNKTYWNDFIKELNLPFEINSMQLKSIVYPMLYGSGIDKIIQKTNLTKENINEVKEKIWNLYPLVYKFLNNDNQYISKTSNVIYDYYGKEMYIEDNYKKINYFLASSLSSHFQLFVYKLRRALVDNNLLTSVVFTVHDSLIVDFINAEKEMFLNIMKEINKELNIPFRFVIKN